jgi:hypothetical protein
MHYSQRIIVLLRITQTFVLFCLSIKSDLSRQLKSSSRIVSSAKGSRTLSV